MGGGEIRPAVTSELASDGSRVNEGLFKEPTNRGHTNGGEQRRDRDLLVMEDVFICRLARTHFAAIARVSLCMEERCDLLRIRERENTFILSQ